MRGARSWPLRRGLALAVLAGAGACEDLRCYDDTDRSDPSPPSSVAALETPTSTEAGEFTVVLHADDSASWPPRAGAVTMRLEVQTTEQELEVEGLEVEGLEVVAAPAFRADDPAVRGDDPSVSPEAPRIFRIAAAVPTPGVWCLPLDLEAGERLDGVDVCFEAR